MKLKPMPDFENMSDPELCLRVAEMENIETIKVADTFYVRDWKDANSLIPIYEFMDSDSTLERMVESELTVKCEMKITTVGFKTKDSVYHMIQNENLNRTVLIAHLLKDELNFRIDVQNGEYE